MDAEFTMHVESPIHPRKFVRVVLQYMLTGQAHLAAIDALTPYFSQTSHGKGNSKSNKIISHKYLSIS